MIKNQKAALLYGMSAAVLCVSAPLRAQTSPSSYTSGYRWDALGKKLGEISPDPDGPGPLPFPAVRYTYDQYGQVTRTEKGSLPTWQDDSIAPANWANFSVITTTDIAYDTDERKAASIVSSNGVVFEATQFSYDAMGMLQCTAVRMNPASLGALPGDACALGATGDQGPDRITKNLYDPAGQLIQVRKAVGTALEQAYSTYSYTLDGKQQDVVDANGNHAALVYDGFDRETQWQFPSTTPPTSFDPSTPASALATAGAVNVNDYEAYGYDQSGNRTSWRKRDGRAFTYAYDGLNRVTSKIVPKGCAPIQMGGCPIASATRDVYYQYDLLGHQTAARFDSASGGDGVFSSYDGYGQLTGTTTAMTGTNRTMAFGYDADSNRTQVTYPDGQVFAYGYDGDDRESLIQQPGGATTVSFSYDAIGQRVGIGRANGANSTMSYDGAGRMTALNHDLAGAVSDVMYRLGYNPASQIVSFSTTNDAYAWTGAFNASKSYTINGLNQYTSVAGASYGYDADANLISDGANSYVYDPENRLVSASNGTTLTYDPNGRLWQSSGGPLGTTQFLYDGDQLSAEYDASGNLLRRYAHGTDEDDPLLWYEGAGLGNLRFYHADHEGSIVAASDTSGNAVVINSYDEYGVPAGGNVGRFQYTGQAWLPDLGLFYYKARLYSPKLGRFLQTDPIGYKDQINLYAYVANDPVNHADPSGNEGEGPGVGHNGGPPLEDKVLGGVEEAGTFVASRIVIGATLLMTSQAAGPLGNPEANARIDRASSRIDNRQNVINDKHISAALREARGEVVRINPRDGQPFDHIGELREARAGLQRDIRALNGQYGHNLSEGQAMKVTNAIGKASKMLDTVNRTLSKVQQICAGTRICP